jgi:hypothetical protein
VTSFQTQTVPDVAVALTRAVDVALLLFLLLAMDSKVILECQWPCLLSFLPTEDELERTARETEVPWRMRLVGARLSYFDWNLRTDSAGSS